MADEATSGRIFISYRRDDTAPTAGRVADRLMSRFGSGSVWVDVDSILPGEDFSRSIADAVGSCSVILVIIGPDWLSAVDEGGRRRLDDPDDFVAVEIAAGLERNIPIIPVLVGGASPPHSADLPTRLAAMARRQAVRLDHDTFATDITTLVKAVERTFGIVPVPDELAPRPAPPRTDPDWTPDPGRSWPRWFYAVDARMADSPPRRWPAATEYVQAVQEAAVSLATTGPLDAQVVHGAFDLPVSSTGRNAIVFELSHPGGDLALRCFTSSPRDAAARYRALAALLASAGCDVVVPARWVDTAIRVGDHALPAVVMPWVDGLPLNLAVENMLDQPTKLNRLAETWLDALSALASARLGHGDLQCGNILVDEAGSIYLVDLDGFYVPKVTNPPGEFGHPHFQHPRRTVDDWGFDMDAFSGLVIHLSLRALASDPDLWRFHAGENLILRRGDYDLPGGTPIWEALRGSRDPEVVRLAELLMHYCEQDTLPRMPEVLRQLRGEEPPPDPDEEWWPPEDSPGEDADTTPPDPPEVAPTDLPMPHRATNWLGRTAVIAGLTSGLICAVLIVSIFAAVGGSVPGVAKAPLLVALAGGLLSGALAGIPRLTMGALRSGLSAGLVGGAIGILMSLIALGGFELATYKALTGQSGVASALIVPAWVLSAVAIGVSAGIMRRSGRALVSGLLGGLVGGLAGGLIHWASGPRFFGDGNNIILELNVLAPSTTIAIFLACIAIGFSMGIVDRVRRRFWLTVFEGSLRGREVILDRQEATIGTTDSATLRLARDAGVEPVHAVLVRDDVGYCLRCEGEVQVNGADHTKADIVRLKHGDKLRVGGSFIRFEQRESL